MKPLKSNLKISTVTTNSYNEDTFLKEYEIIFKTKEKVPYLCLTNSVEFILTGLIFDWYVECQWFFYSFGFIRCISLCDHDNFLCIRKVWRCWDFFIFCPSQFLTVKILLFLIGKKAKWLSGERSFVLFPFFEK